MCLHWLWRTFVDVRGSARTLAVKLEHRQPDYCCARKKQQRLPRACVLTLLNREEHHPRYTNALSREKLICNRGHTACMSKGVRPRSVLLSFKRSKLRGWRGGKGMMQHPSSKGANLPTPFAHHSCGRQNCHQGWARCMCVQDKHVGVDGVSRSVPFETQSLSRVPQGNKCRETATHQCSRRHIDRALRSSCIFAQSRSLIDQSTVKPPPKDES